MQYKRYALVETAEDVDAILQNYNYSELQWVALSPFCIPRLQKQTIKCSALEEYINQPELFEEVNKYSEHVIDEITTATDEWIKSNYNDFSIRSLFLLKYFRYYLTILFDGIYLRMLLLDHFFSSNESSEVIIHKSIAPNSSPLKIFPWNQDDTVWAMCIELILKQRYTSYKASIIETIAAETNSIEKTSLYSFFLKRFPKTYYAIRALKKRGINSAIRFTINENILLLNDKQWKYAVSYLDEYGFNVIPITREQRSYDVVSYEDYVERIELRKYLSFRGLDLTEVFKEHLNRCIHYGITNFIRTYDHAQEILKKWKPRALLFSVIDRPQDWVIVHAAKKMGCLVFVWGHGASGQASLTKQYRNELLICDFYFTQGMGSQETYKEYKGYKYFIKPVGFPMLEDLQKKIINRKKNKYIYEFVYATTDFYKNNFYFSFFPGITDSHLYQVQEKIILFLKRKECRCLLKIGMCSYSEHLFYEAFGQIIQIESYKPLTDIIPDGQAFIIDCPTTTLLEVLCTERPVFVLTQFIKLTDNAEKLLRKRAVCCRTVDELIQVIDNYIVQGAYPADLKNQEYLCAFGTYINDGQSAKRGAKTVIEVLNKQSQISISP